MVAARREILELDEPRVRYFRARRSHLAGRGADSAARAAGAILGAQAQQEAPALFALSQRTRERPTAAALRSMLFDDGARSLVRTWGQRDTLHVYDPRDWPAVTAARRQWPQTGRRGVMPSEELVAAARARFERATAPLLRSDLFDLIPPDYLAEAAAHPGAGSSPIRLAASRLIWCLAMAGEICFGPKRGAEQTYVHRQLWFADLDWPKTLDPGSSASRLARRYLAVHGPATPADIAHFFGTRVASVKLWLESLENELVRVACGERKGLVALAADAGELRRAAPREGEWPLRLLPQWDTHLMRHKDKSWLLARAEETREVWRKAANVLPTVLAEGRVVATWSHRATRRRVRITVGRLSGWRAAYRRAVEAEAVALAAHLEVAGSEVELADGAA